MNSACKSGGHRSVWLQTAAAALAGDRRGPGDGGFGDAVRRALHRRPAGRAGRADVGLPAGERERRSATPRARRAPARGCPGAHACPPATRTLAVTLVNRLTVPTSVVLSGAGAGQRRRCAGVGGATWSVRRVTRPPARWPIASPAACARSPARPLPGASRTYTFTNLRPGSFLLAERHAPAGAGADGPVAGMARVDRHAPVPGLRPRLRSTVVLLRSRCRHARPHRLHAGQRRPDAAGRPAATAR